MRAMHEDSSGQAIPIDYILIFSMSVLFFGLLTMSFSSVVDNSTQQAIYSELKDVGNQVSFGITSAYLSIPVEGESVSVIDIPKQVANNPYYIDVSEDNPYKYGQNALKIKSGYRDVTVYVPLSSVDELIYVNGSVSSASGKITITSNLSGIFLTQG